MDGVNDRVRSQQLTPTDSVANAITRRWCIVNHLVIADVDAVVRIEAALDLEMVAKSQCGWLHSIIHMQIITFCRVDGMRTKPVDSIKLI